MLHTLKSLTLLHCENFLGTLFVAGLHHAPELTPTQLINLHEITFESTYLFFAESERTAGPEEPERFVQPRGGLSGNRKYTLLG